MNDLDMAVYIGLGFSIPEIAQIKQTVDAEITSKEQEIIQLALNKIKPQLNDAVTNVIQGAKAYVAQQAAKAGETGAQAARSAVIKYSLIAGAVGIVGGGLLGWQLARRFPRRHR